MIKLTPKPTFRFKVEVSLPGGAEPARFVLIGRHITQTALKSWADRAREQVGNDVDHLLEFVEGWDEVMDDENRPVKFSPDTFATLLDAYPGLGMAVIDAFIRELNVARQKN